MAFVALIPLLWLVRDGRPRRGFLVGLVFGFAYFGAVLYWILLFGRMAWTALVLASAGFVGAFGLLAPALWRRERPWLSAAGVAALWTAIEWVRSAWPLGGFTWGQLGTTQAGNHLLLPLASVTGVWGISFVVALVNALLLAAWERGRARIVRAIFPVAVAGVIVAGPALIPLPAPDGRSISVAAVQVDVRTARGLPALAEDRAVAELNVASDRKLASDPPDLVVWGEGALDPGASRADVHAEVTSAIRSVGVPTLAGSIQPGPDGELFNQALLFDGDGRLVARYSKVHLVPFGEYVPFRRELGWISALRQIPYDLTPGERLHTIQAPGVGLPPIGAAICFENSFPSIDRSLVNDGAGLIVILTNNASYEETAASRQHLIMSQIRAVEDGRWVVHAAVSGITAFVDPTGRIVSRTGLFEPRILRGTVVASDRRTIYVRFGDWFPLLSVIVAAGIVLLPRRRRAPAPEPESLAEQPRTLVILPTYEERETIEIVVERLLELPDHVDVLVVDDSSPDHTADLVRAIADREPRVRLVVRPAKSGLGSAYLAGFRTALDDGYDLIVEMDSDLSHDPAELPALLAGARDFDLAIGSRYIPGGSISNWSRGRVALSKAGNRYARASLGFDLHDATSGYRVYRRRLLQHIVARPFRSDGYGFQIELAHRAWNLGYRVGEVPITFREREHGHSKISRAIVLEALWLITVWGAKARLWPGRGA